MIYILYILINRYIINFTLSHILKITAFFTFSFNFLLFYCYILFCYAKKFQLFWFTQLFQRKTRCTSTIWQMFFGFSILFIELKICLTLTRAQKNLITLFKHLIDVLLYLFCHNFFCNFAQQTQCFKKSRKQLSIFFKIWQFSRILNTQFFAT